MKILNILIAGILMTGFCHSVFSQNINPEKLKQHVSFLASDEMKGRGFGSPQGLLAAEYIREQFREAGVSPLVDDYFHSFYHRIGVLNIHGQNVIGVIEGNDPDLKNEYIVIGAHYDHIGWDVKKGDTLIYNGADDNASGVAGIIELGRYLSENRDKLKRSVIIAAFDSEESGLLGARRVLGDGLVDTSAVKAMFSLDMIGMYSGHEGVDLEGIQLLRDYLPMVETAKKEYPVNILKMNAKVVPNTDTGPFGKAGIPAIHVFTGLESPYHKPEDVDTLLDYEGMATILNFMTGLTMEMAERPELVASPVAEGMKKAGGMKRFYAGVTLKNGESYFDYPDEFYKSKSIYAIGAGVFMEVRISQVLTLQPEVIYMTEGGKQTAGNLRLHSVTTPLSLLITTPDPASMNVRGYFQAGGYFSYTFAGKLGSTNMDFDTEYRDQNFGILIGGGMEIMNFRMGYTRMISQQNLMKDTGAGNMLLNGSYVTIGWAF